MTDLERIELACRRILDHLHANTEKMVGTDAIIHFTMIRVFATLLVELEQKPITDPDII